MRLNALIDRLNSIKDRNDQNVRIVIDREVGLDRLVMSFDYIRVGLDCVGNINLNVFSGNEGDGK